MRTVGHVALFLALALHSNALLGTDQLPTWRLSASHIWGWRVQVWRVSR